MNSVSYQYPVDALYTGSSLGNEYAFAQLDAATNLRGLWSSLDNQFYVGEWVVEVEVEGKQLGPLTTRFNPESQVTALGSGRIEAEKLFFIPFFHDQTGRDPSDFQTAVYLIRLNNRSGSTLDAVVRHLLTFPAVPYERFIKKPPAEQTQKRVIVERRGTHCEVTTQGKPSEARVFGSHLQWLELRADDKRIAVSYRISVGPHEEVEIPFVLGFSPDGLAAALKALENSLSGKNSIEVSRNEYEAILRRCNIVTPEPVINRGLQWAKVNTVRVQHRFRAGHGFTNDPPQDIVVIRDLAWYVLGSDYLTPGFSSKLLELAERYAFHKEGKLTEFIRAFEEVPALNDYKLNINDDTPLFVHALYHHAACCEPEEFLQSAYPLMKRACDYILSQLKDGLVRCYADGTNVWGICGWRNIIDGYNLTGAVTEVNAECHHALKLLSLVAERLGFAKDAGFYRSSADRLKQAINSKLHSGKTGMYLLTLDNDGAERHDVTGDLIFPVMFDVADEPTRKKILDALTGEDMWTPFGSRTVSRKEPNYDPDFGYQLLGGIWPNLTAWIALCIRSDRPEKLVEGMLNIYKLCEVMRPVDFMNVVPGEFPERLHGETYQSRGMAMSPWMPPTYLWLGVEGLLGVKPSLGELEMDPVLPAAWKWIAVKDLPWKGDFVSAFVHEGTLFATRKLRTSLPLRVFRLLESAAEPEGIFSIGVEIEGHPYAFAASDEDAKADVTVMHNGKEITIHVRLRKGESIFTDLRPAEVEISSASGVAQKR